jgi:hypothetical protein
MTAQQKFGIFFIILVIATIAIFSGIKIKNEVDKNEFEQIYNTYKQEMDYGLEAKLPTVDSNIITAVIEPVFTMKYDYDSDFDYKSYKFNEEYNIEIEVGKSDLDSMTIPDQQEKCEAIFRKIKNTINDEFKSSAFAEYLGENGGKSRFKEVYDVDLYHHFVTYHINIKTSANTFYISEYSFSINDKQYTDNMINNIKAGRPENYVAPTPKPTPAPKKEPAIGMTAAEVEASTWGKPKSINKTTTIYGTSEQWVYSGFRYIYIDYGYVTAIQE